MLQHSQSPRWTENKAKQWHKNHPWLVGCNYIPRTASNQLEMWQRETFDPATIDQELTWAAGLGFNSLRVFLHDLPWKHDQGGFVERLERFLDIADNHGIGVMFVLFDSCWHPFPHWGPQRPPEPGVHNSCWVQSPGVDILRDEKHFNQLESYVTGIIKFFADDHRIHAWDIWNEPDNSNGSSYGPRDLGNAKADIVAPLLAKAFTWARAAKPRQPLTTGLWAGKWSTDSSLRLFERVQINLSDILSFHAYSKPESLLAGINDLARFNRPLICTEYLARGCGSTFEGVLPLFKKHRVAAYNWGFVAGRTQTQFPWDSWQRAYDPAGPDLWHHEICHASGKPYRQEEVDLIRKLCKGRK